MIFMTEENKPQGKTIVLNKKLVIAIVAIILAVAVWFLFINKCKAEYVKSDSPILGNSNATVNVIEFSDYECPYCQAAEGANQVVIADLKRKNSSWEAPVPNIINEYVNAGKVKLIFRDYPVHRNNNPALASKCAQAQGKFWEYHSILFENYNALEITDLKKYAVDLDLNVSQFNECFDSAKYLGSIQSDTSDGQCLGVGGTPTFFVGSEAKGYEKIEGAASFLDFKKVIDSKLS